MCSVIKKNAKGLFDDMTVSHVYHLAEIQRLFNCDSLKGITEQVRSVLKNDLSKMTKPANIYYAYLMNADAKEYGLEGPVAEVIDRKTVDQLIPNFN